MVLGQQPNISHMRTFRCVVYVPVAPPQHTKMGFQRTLGIYIVFELPFIFGYLEPLTGDMFTTQFADYRLDETLLPKLGGESNENKGEILLKNPSLSHLDPLTSFIE